jgi:Ca-activated chloride channel family protein
MRPKEILTNAVILFLLIPAVAATIFSLAGCASAPVGLTRLSPMARPVGGSAVPISYSGEELWVIARGKESGPASGEETPPGIGSLLARVEDKQIPMPLKHTDVHGTVNGYIGAVEVTQQFLNPYSSKIEAVYVFPLPHNAAVNEFIMTIGDRHIRGIIREREEARQLYEQARAQGYVAALLTEERPNIFTQSVANIEPGKEIDVHIKYLQTLEYADGWYEFIFPMVIGPRFNPKGSTNGIGAVPAGASGISKQPAEVSYLKPDEWTGHDVSLKVEVDAGVAIEEVECKSHDIIRDAPSPSRVVVSLDPEEKLPNRDFVLRYRVAGDRIKSSLLTQRDQTGGYFTLMLYPPRQLEALPRQPLELVFVIDCSGSMNGRPIAQAKAAVQRGLRLLQRGDSFQIISFSMQASQFGPSPVEANSANIQRALKYVAGLEGEGGTMMIEGIKAALDFPHDPRRLRFVCFLTDGYIGNETEILGEIHKRLGPSRIFSFGIGSAVNRYLIENMGKAGRGAVAYLGSHDEAAAIMEDFFERISHPALTDLQIDWGESSVAEVFPSRLPDLFVGRPVILTGRFSQARLASFKIKGHVAGETVELNIPVPEELPGASTPVLAAIWARFKISELAEHSTYEPGAGWTEQIKQVALDFGLMSAFTSFIAVDASRATKGSQTTTVPVAVPVPEGVKYHSTVHDP